METGNVIVRVIGNWNGNELDEGLTKHICSLKQGPCLLPQVAREGIVEEKHVNGFLLCAVHKVVPDCPLN